MPGAVKQRLSAASVKDVTVVSFTDRMLIHEDMIREVGEQIQELIPAKEAMKLLLNFQQVRHMSSSMLGILLPLSRALAKNGGQLKLCSLEPGLREVFKVTKLERAFVIYEDEASALAAF